jgi:hypothetical protein
MAFLVLGISACGSSTQHRSLSGALLQPGDVGSRFKVVVSGSRWDHRTMTGLATSQTGSERNCRHGRFVRFSGSGGNSIAAAICDAGRQIGADLVYAAAQLPFAHIMATDIANQHPRPVKVAVGNEGVAFLESPFTPPPLPRLRQVVFRRGQVVGEVDTEQIGSDDPAVTLTLARRLDYRIRQLQAGCPMASAGCGGRLPPVPRANDFAPPAMPAPPGVGTTIP